MLPPAALVVAKPRSGSPALKPLGLAVDTAVLDESTEVVDDVLYKETLRIAKRRTATRISIVVSGVAACAIVAIAVVVGITLTALYWPRSPTVTGATVNFTKFRLASYDSKLFQLKATVNLEIAGTLGVKMTNTNLVSVDVDAFVGRISYLEQDICDVAFTPATLAAAASPTQAAMSVLHGAMSAVGTDVHVSFDVDFSTLNRVLADIAAQQIVVSIEAQVPFDVLGVRKAPRMRCDVTVRLAARQTGGSETEFVTEQMCTSAR